MIKPITAASIATGSSARANWQQPYVELAFAKFSNNLSTEVRIYFSARHQLDCLKRPLVVLAWSSLPRSPSVMSTLLTHNLQGPYLPVSGKPQDVSKTTLYEFYGSGGGRRGSQVVLQGCPDAKKPRRRFLKPCAWLLSLAVKSISCARSACRPEFLRASPPWTQVTHCPVCAHGYHRADSNHREDPEQVQ